MTCPLRRAGTTLLEILVAMMVLAIALAGLCPLMVMQMKLLRRIESQPMTDNPQVIRGVRMVDGVADFPEKGDVSQPVLFLQPQPNDWVRSLGGAATFQADATPQDYSPGLIRLDLVDGDPNNDATWRLPQVGMGRYRVILSGSIPNDVVFSLTDGSMPPVTADVPAVGTGPWYDLRDHSLGPGPWYDLGEHSLMSTLELRLEGATAVDVGVWIGPRNEVKVQPLAPSDPQPTEGGATTRVIVERRP